MIVFRDRPLSLLPAPETTAQVAILVTSEYEGLFRNGGVGTYYQNLSAQMAGAGWYVLLLLAHQEGARRFGGGSHLPTVQHIFATHELEDVLELQALHRSLLGSTTFAIDRESFCCLFYIQAIADYFHRSQLYIEFHEMQGLGYRTVQAQATGAIAARCTVGVTLHSGMEWLFETNEKFTGYDLAWSQAAYHFEQYSFEQADVGFFPSQHLQARVASYGWQTRHAQHQPNPIPLCPIPMFSIPKQMGGDRP